MYRKTAIAAALAASFAVPAANGAEFQISDKAVLEIYGSVEPIIINETDADGDSATEFQDNDSQIGFDAEYKFSDAVTGFGRAEFEYDADEENDDGLASVDEAYFGLKGGFGSIKFGTHDTLFEDEVGEMIDLFETVSPSEPRNNGEGNQITYFSPSFGGFSFGAEARFLGENEDENPSGSSETGIELVGRYDAENWGVSAGYADGSTAESGGVLVDESTIGVGGYVGFGNIELSALYATQDEAGGGSTDRIGAGIGFNYGGGNVYVAVQDVSPDGGDSRTELAAGIYHDLYDNLTIYLEAGRFDNVNDEGDIVAAGAIFEF